MTAAVPAPRTASSSMAGIPSSRPCATAAARSEGCSRPRTRRGGSRRRSATSRPSPRSSVRTRSTGSSGRTPSIRGSISRPGRCPRRPSRRSRPTRSCVVLDQITDPHNVGAIVRSCAAFGVDAVVTTARHSPAATGVLAKSASGGLEHVPFLTVRNLAEALIALGERGFARVGFDSSGEAELGARRRAAPARSRARRRRQGLAPAHARLLRRRRPARDAGRDQEPQRLERRRRRALRPVAPAAARLERDDFSSSCHPALSVLFSMIFSENRFPLFGIMLHRPRGAVTSMMRGPDPVGPAWAAKRAWPCWPRRDRRGVERMT